MPGLRELGEQFLMALSKAQELRINKFLQIGDEPEWMIYEREVMLRSVNAVRLQRDRPLIPVEWIKKAERCASGHADYSRKFALYCAELALAD